MRNRTRPITIEGYLTETKLSTALQQMVGDLWVGGQVQLPGSRHRWDTATTLTFVVLVEFDGDAHYRESLKIKADREKDRIAGENHMRVVRVPYWIQLDNVTVRHYFQISAEIRQTFPHGFISTKLFPASFCEMGIERFKNDLHALPSPVREAVVQSLRKRIEENGLEYGLPSSLRELVSV